MGRKIQMLTIHEDISTLKGYLPKCKSLRQEKRLRALLYFKETAIPDQEQAFQVDIP